MNNRSIICRASHPGDSFSFLPSVNFPNYNQIQILLCPLLVVHPVRGLDGNCFSIFILIFPPLCSLPGSSLRSPVPSLLAFCISSSWPPSPGCVWRGCSSISCWWRSLRASTPAKSTTICAATASPALVVGISAAIDYRSYGTKKAWVWIQAFCTCRLRSRIMLLPQLET